MNRKYLNWIDISILIHMKLCVAVARPNLKYIQIVNLKVCERVIYMPIISSHQTHFWHCCQLVILHKEIWDLYSLSMKTDKY